MHADFPSYFRALWGYDPFPWQAMLADRVAVGDWPMALDLPTAAGKTACIDIAVFALARQADRPVWERTAPRRVWFVVDRRIVVDEAFERASRIARELAAATDGPLKEVADRLRAVSGTERPLAVGRLRGGTLRDDGWARIPSQGAVITSTVDQLGSRLLFRGYGHSFLTAPIFAGLAANDSLILLDEAHCAVPFMQTLEAIGRYRGPAWAEEAILTPFRGVVMSATPPRDIPSQAVFPGNERATALDHPELERRLGTSKLADLVTLGSRRRNHEDPLVVEAAQRAETFLRDGRPRVAVMVNRVRTAMEIEARLRDRVGEGGADVVLLTGRIRPLDRDILVERWTPYLRASRPDEPERPIVVVTTQCLEVGADFSFDALVTECASLDALRQRFGRLARLGADEPAPGVILIRASDVEAKEPDPVYGSSLAATWTWLVEQASEDVSGRRVVDLGVDALGSRLEGEENLPSFLAPSPDAPVLLPAHLDLLCQTAPPPYPEPDVSLYLHGRPGAAEVSVVWRCDLPSHDTGTWVETTALCPPVSGEMLQAPLSRVRAWLAQRFVEDEAGDVEGSVVETEAAEGRIRPCVVWRGRDRSRVVSAANDLRPGDVLVVPASYGIEGLGQAIRARAVGEERLDLWEAARVAAGQGPAIRVHEAALRQWLDCPPIKELVAAATSGVPARGAIQEAIDAVVGYQPAEGSPPAPPDWWVELLKACRTARMLEHPSGGVILLARAGSLPGSEPDLFADDDDLASAANRDVSLDEHAELVRRAAVRIGDRCLPERLRDAVALAAFWHDAGKLDPRFQLMLRQGDEVAWATAERAIAKSAVVPGSPARRRAIREASGLPEAFRHEMLSMELVSRFAELPEDEALADLVLHLVASHHGHGRPFAPVSSDPSPPDIRGVLGSTEVTLGGRERSTATPAHRLDSGITERFWRLSRRYGWWGLAYLEALLRLADWYGSNFALAKGGDS